MATKTSDVRVLTLIESCHNVVRATASASVTTDQLVTILTAIAVDRGARGALLDLIYHVTENIAPSTPSSGEKRIARTSVGMERALEDTLRAMGAKQ